MENKYDEPSFYDARPLIINGKKYHSATANKCPVCSSGAGDGRYMFVKSRLSGGIGDVVLECPNCDHTLTLAPGMVKLNLSDG